MSSNKSLVNIVVVFVAIVVIVACCDSNKDSNNNNNNNTRIRTKLYKTVNTREICRPRPKPKTQKGRVEQTEYKYPARIYRVESRDEFENCHVNEANKLIALVICDDSKIDSDIPLNLFQSDFVEKKEYLFLAVSSTDSTDRVNGVCDDFVVRFSITIDLDDDEYLNVLIYG